MSPLISLDNPLFATYMFYASLLILKMLFMAFWTVRFRLKNKALAAPEDYVGEFKGHKIPDKPDPDVERVRNAHRNDLENILPFLILGFLFVMTDPNVVLAKWFFRIFTILRFWFTFVYLNAIGNRARAPGFLGPLAINIIMAVMVAYKMAGHF
eukprot:Seg1646.10 transcript_id=Seg1646.10/GoldUCD/mRNA.D3Y31 product="hypothetical protein" protein_id=Seg1646.10/GoldUCD/D3Y31